jgi:hypothetical protein
MTDQSYSYYNEYKRQPYNETLPQSHTDDSNPQFQPNLQEFVLQQYLQIQHSTEEYFTKREPVNNVFTSQSNEDIKQKNSITKNHPSPAVNKGQQNPAPQYQSPNHRLMFL